MPLKRQSHQQAGPKPSREATDDAETAGEIELFGVRIADHMQAGRSLGTCDLRAMFDQPFADALALNVRLHEQSVELRVAVFACHDRRKADDGAMLLQHENTAGRDLLNR